MPRKKRHKQQEQTPEKTTQEPSQGQKNAKRGRPAPNKHNRVEKLRTCQPWFPSSGSSQTQSSSIREAQCTERGKCIPGSKILAHPSGQDRVAAVVAATVVVHGDMLGKEESNGCDGRSQGWTPPHSPEMTATTTQPAHGMARSFKESPPAESVVLLGCAC